MFKDTHGLFTQTGQYNPTLTPSVQEPFRESTHVLKCIRGPKSKIFNCSHGWEISILFGWLRLCKKIDLLFILSYQFFLNGSILGKKQLSKPRGNLQIERNFPEPHRTAQVHIIWNLKLKFIFFLGWGKILVGLVGLGLSVFVIRECRARGLHRTPGVRKCWWRCPL